MSSKTDHENREIVLAENICNLLYDLSSSTYNEIRPKIEFWIDYVLDEQLSTAADLANRVMPVAWDTRGSQLDISLFLREFRNASHRSEQAKTFVDELCTSILRWFSVASSEDLWVNWSTASVSKRGGSGFIRAASFVGHLITLGLLDHKLVRRHIYKPLTAHYYNKSNLKKQAIRAHAIYALFETAGNTLLRGLLEPEEVQECFNKLDTRVSFKDIGGMDKFDSDKLKGFHEIHDKWLEGEQRNETTAEVPVPGIADPAAARIDVGGPSSSSNNTEPFSTFRDIPFSPDTLIDAQVSTPSSPALSFSTISDLAPTELDPGESSSERSLTRHRTFYLEDGNVEIICGQTIFRIHSSIVSFSSSRLREILSPSALLSAPMSETGCPRIFPKDSADDFAVLLKMISTPWFPIWHKVPEFDVFASLLRMATKYDFPDVREQLLHRLEEAYPTKWEACRTAKVLGEDVFGSPKPHPNEVLNLFLQQNVRFAIPVAAYRAGLGEFSSLVSSKPGMDLPRLALASVLYGMYVIRNEVSRRARSIVCDVSLKGCPDGKCVVNGGVKSPKQRAEGMNKIYDVMVNGGSKGDVLSALSLGDFVCASCAAAAGKEYDLLRVAVWENLPRIFRVSSSWEEV